MQSTFTGALVGRRRSVGQPRHGERPGPDRVRADAVAVMASRTSVSGSTVCAKGLTAGRAATRNGGASPGLTEARVDLHRRAACRAPPRFWTHATPVQRPSHAGCWRSHRTRPPTSRDQPTEYGSIVRQLRNRRLDDLGQLIVL